ncbi:MAG: hypothetical protein ABJL92_09275 [Sulfitobacter sp.]|uniref:hypothetical protein n=1 Tax=Sulfitobacter sp. TaxID=1903071 RepID=UPI003296D626
MTARRPKICVSSVRLRINGAAMPSDLSRAIRQELATLSPEQWRQLATDPKRKVILDPATTPDAAMIGRTLKGGKA